MDLLSYFRHCYALRDRKINITQYLSSWSWWSVQEVELDKCDQCCKSCRNCGNKENFIRCKKCCHHKGCKAWAVCWREGTSLIDQRESTFQHVPENLAGAAGMLNDKAWGLHCGEWRAIRLDGGARSHTVKGFLRHTKNFGLYPVSGMETLKDMIRYAQCKEQPDPSSVWTSLPINRPTRRGVGLISSYTNSPVRMI